MTAVDAAPPRTRPSLHERSPNARSRRFRNGLASMLLRLTVLLALIPLALILYEVIRLGAAAMNWEFLTHSTPFSVIEQGGGFYQGLIGTALMVGIAAVLSVPLGILTALFLVEFPDSRLVKPVRFFTDVMTGVPSVFVGLFIYALLVGTYHFGTLMGAFALGIIMLPIVVRSGEEVLKLVPHDLRVAAYGLGSRRWQAAFKVVLPAGRSGLITGSMLAVARAAGETAPLLLTALGSLHVVYKLTGEPQSALPILIWDGAKSAFIAGQQRAWAGSLELMLIVLVFTVAARIVGGRSNAGAT